MATTQAPPAVLDRPTPSSPQNPPGELAPPLHEDRAKHRLFPGWLWVAVAIAFPIGGLIGRAVAGPVDAIGAALLGGVLTGAVLGVGQWLAARGELGNGPVWIGASALGYGVGLAGGAALVGFGTELGELAAMGAVSGVALGAAQGLALALQGRTRLGIGWAAAMPVLLVFGWSASTLVGVDVGLQFTVFGAAGAVLFMLLSGLLLARLTPPRPQTA
jgi:hypothetical protein